MKKIIAAIIGVVGLIMALPFIFAAPLWYLWNTLGPVYFSFVPDTYQDLPFWHVFGLIWLISMLKYIFTPKFSSVTNTNTAS